MTLVQVIRRDQPTLIVKLELMSPVHNPSLVLESMNATLLVDECPRCGERHNTFKVINEFDELRQYADQSKEGVFYSIHNSHLVSPIIGEIDATLTSEHTIGGRQRISLEASCELTVQGEMVEGSISSRFNLPQRGKHQVMDSVVELEIELLSDGRMILVVKSESTRTDDERPSISKLRVERTQDIPEEIMLTVAQLSFHNNSASVDELFERIMSDYIDSLNLSNWGRD